MKNPLRKRLPREFKSEFSKYLVIFLFMALTIGFVSGFLVAGGSMITAYDNSFEKYNIEDGHFVVNNELDEAAIKNIEADGVKLYENYYIDLDTDVNGDSKDGCTVRVFKNRTEVDKICIMKGELPSNQNEIAIDRMFADNNSLEIGDKITVRGKELKVTGLVALSDYSALFSSNTDLMFDSIKFGVAIVNDEYFDSLSNDIKKYSYAFTYNEAPKNETESKEMSDKFMEKLVKEVMVSGNSIADYIPEYSNQAIHFTGDDMGGDKAMMIVLLYILIVIMAFVFAITISHTITKEATVIGTLRASGYTRGELLGHYLTLPMIVTVAAALIGNILGYTLFKDIVAAMYYGSYSLPTYETIWNGEAFVLTTIIPLIIMLFVNVLVLVNKLKLSPLKFIKRDLTKKTKKKAVKLPHFKFFTRFRIRILIQNIVNYIMLFIGIALASVLLLFGLMMKPLLENYQDEITDNMISNYQYVLKGQVEVENKDAEKYSVNSLKIKQDDGEGEEVNVYGIAKDSKYVTDKLPENEVIISSSYAEKYGIDEGDEIELEEIYDSKQYKFKVADIKKYPSGISIFMTNDMFADTFGKDEGYFNGYFSNEKLDEIDEKYIAATITIDDLTKVSRQLDKSMGEMFQLVNVFSIVLVIILIYLLTKLVIEKNSNAISMVKILGYNNGEISRLYLIATTWAVVISTLLNMYIATVVIDEIYFEMMKDYPGWLTLYIGPATYVKMFVMIMAAYIVVALLQFRKIKKIPMDEALKNVE